MSSRNISEVIATKSIGAAAAVLLAVTILVAITSEVFWARSLQVPATEPPRLVVLIVIDQFRADYPEWYGAQWTRGLKRLFGTGAVFTNARLPYAGTWTCAGHASIGTGTLPSRHGMVANYWFDAATQAVVPCSDDESASPVDLGGGAGIERHSGRAMAAPAFADELRRQARRQPQIVSISLKPRSAIGLGGHGGPGTMVLWEDDRGGWTSSSAFTATGWPEAREFIAKRPVTGDYGQTWTKLLPASAYRFADNAPGEAPPAPWGPTFPHVLRSPTGRPDGYFFGAWDRSPMADAYITDLALHLATRLKLGQQPGTDMLALGFSALDLVGHEYGPHSHEVQDMLARLDLQIGRLLDALDKTVGRDKYVVALSADHGVAPLPEQMAQTGVDAGRIPSELLQRAVQQSISASLGGGVHYLGYSDGRIFLAPGRMDALRRRPGAVDALTQSLERVPGMWRVYTMDQLSASAPTDDAMLRRARQSYFAGRTGDLMVIPKPHWIVRSIGTAHGSPHEYDDRVPLVFAGAGIVAGSHAVAASPLDIVPTLARLVGITMPATDGQVRAEVVRPK